MNDERDSTQRARVAAEAAAEKLGADIVLLDVSEILQIVDWFVIASASNTRQVKTIADEVEEAIKSLDGVGPLRTEGLDDGRWVLLDFGDVVVHIFLDEVRTFYNLERLWGDVPKIVWNDQRGTAQASN
ncbi:MAG: ribosome silencing factor [Acidimicrobiales bacterium]